MYSFRSEQAAVSLTKEDKKKWQGFYCRWKLKLVYVTFLKAQSNVQGNGELLLCRWMMPLQSDQVCFFLVLCGLVEINFHIDLLQARNTPLGPREFS